MIKSILKNVGVDRVMESVAAGTAANVSDTVDTAGCESVLFNVTLGAITTNGIATAKLSQSDSSGSGFADLLGTSIASTADADAQGILQLEIIDPGKRYLRCTVTTSVANVEIDNVTALTFGKKKMPITENDDIIGSEQHIAPAEGTA